MAVTDLKPADFNENHAAYARMVPGFDFYTQGMPLGKTAVWLRIGGCASTMIGLGLPDEALREAEVLICEQLLKLRAEIERRKAAG